MRDNPAGDPAKAPFGAIHEGDAATVAALLNIHPELLNAVDKYHGHTPLHHAAYWNKNNVAEMLLAKGADVNARDSRGRTPLHVRSVYRTPEVAELLLAHGADANAKDNEGFTLIFSAASRYIAELLVAHGSDLNVSSPGTRRTKRGEGWPQGWTPLHAAAAAFEGDADLAEYLLEKGCDVNARTSEWETPLYQAIGSNRAKLVSVLLSHGAKVNLIGRLRETALSRAIGGDQREIVELLSDHGAKMPKEDDTALHLAMGANAIAVAECLLQRGENVNAPDLNGGTPLLKAVQMEGWGLDYDSTKMVDLLLAHGANLNGRDTDGWTPLHVALAVQARPLVKMLIAHGAEVDIFAGAAIGEGSWLAKALAQNPELAKVTDRMGQTPLHWAAMTGSDTAAGILLACHADINARDRDGASPLHIAAERGHERMIQILLDGGADINIPDTDGRTPIISAGWKHSSIVALLVARGANVNHPDKNGWSRLHYDAYAGEIAAVAVLLAFGAQFNLLSNENRTPLDLAIREHHQDIAALLRRHGALRGKQLPRQN